MSVTSISAVSPVSSGFANVNPVANKSASSLSKSQNSTIVTANRSTAPLSSTVSPAKVSTNSIAPPKPGAGSASALAEDLQSVSYGHVQGGKTYTGTVQATTGSIYEASVAGLPVSGSSLAARETTLGTIINTLA